MKRSFVFASLFLLNSVISFGQTIEPKPTLREVQVFPNPTTEILFLKNGEIIQTYRILDMNGKVVQEGYHNAQIITLLDVEPGFYLLEMKAEDEIRSVRIQKR